MGSAAIASKHQSQLAGNSFEHVFPAKTIPKRRNKPSTENGTTSNPTGSLAKSSVDGEMINFDKHLEDIFGPFTKTKPDIDRQTASNSDDSKSDDSKFDLVVLLSAEDLHSNHKGMSTSIPSFDDQLDSLADDIDDALTGHDDVMKAIRGHSLTRVDSSVGIMDPGGELRKKGSAIEPLPGVIPIRVNWSDPEKIMRQERLLHKTFEAKIKSLQDVTINIVQEPHAEVDVKNTQTSTGSGDSHDSITPNEPVTKPKPIIIQFEYSNEELELMRSIEKEYGWQH
ncbi:uncharacterized protein [Apostichopus japonicus]|uniref:uncharacterized protein n=1 Tax=Stichopus japonicus TaxID=307972 RepID=UPI003AB2ECBA